MRVRKTHEPESADVAVRQLLDAGDVDRLSSLIHNLIAEVADLTVRVRNLEAERDGRPPETEPQQIQAAVGTVVQRVTGH